MVEIGIDLGTSNSLIAYFDKEAEEVRLIPNRFGNFLTPSVVSLDEADTVVVGDIAKARKMTHPKVTVSAFKRFMGLDKTYKLGKHQFSPVELSSFVLKSLKEDAERELNQPVTDVVISVPAYFNAFQREATISAAKLAGLTVSQLISEPTCASLAYGIENADEDQNFLVVDLGGGTYDVSLISMFEQIIQVEAISGDTNLGGEDFTHAIVDEALKKIGAPREENALLAELYAKAEKMKQKFSDLTTLSASFDVEYNGEEVSFILTQTEFRELVMPLLARLQRPTKRVMNDSRMSYEELDKVILVGGATRLEVVKQALQKITDIKPSSDVNPDEAVVIGAALRAHMLNDSAREELIMTDVIGFSLGTAVHNEQFPGKNLFSPIIERNTTIPASVVDRFHKITENQKLVNFRIYQGERAFADENLHLGTIEYQTGNLSMKDAIYVRYSYDESGILEVEIWNEKNVLRKSLTIQNRHSKLSDKELEAVRKRLKDLKVNPMDKDENQLILARFDQLYAEFLSSNRDHIQVEQQRFLAELKSNNPRRVHEAQKRANDLLEYFEGLL